METATLTAAVACWASVNVTTQVPTAAGVTVNVADGPAADAELTVATDAQVSLSPNVPE